MDWLVVFITGTPRRLNMVWASRMSFGSAAGTRTRCRAALLADRLQALRIDGEAEDP
jgi:hypothetical protein